MNAPRQSSNGKTDLSKCMMKCVKRCFKRDTWTLREKEEEEEKRRVALELREIYIPAPSLLLLPRKRFSIFFIYHLCIIVINVTREQNKDRYTSIEMITDAIESY